MTSLTLTPVSGSDLGLKDALVASNLPIEDLDCAGRSFFRATTQDGEVVAYSGIEACSGDLLLRSVVVLPAHRGRSLGPTLVQETLAFTGTSGVYLATTSAGSFFEKLGFVAVDRNDVPANVMATRQLSSICPASATIMKLNRPPS